MVLESKLRTLRILHPMLYSISILTCIKKHTENKCLRVWESVLVMFSSQAALLTAPFDFPVLQEVLIFEENIN